MSYAGAWLAAVFMACLVGSWLIWLWHERDKQREAEAAAEWKALLEPNRDGDFTPHDPLHTITERPLLPDDYKDWNFR